ncbi:Uu.00g048410.m01.CDS01 [Anthostomella pinea]|uniref:Uu.00g048410.m01.CDS01 n=1 Tax=Anthostomella pinea TaxID=933095 RepID=A0AAI8VBT7_9PEZI|nr:Uu.00g048410.m01.CDS01 [Anthostomella pinea]
MAPTTKPKLAQLTTPVTATFPSELSALSARTPLSAVPAFVKEEYPGGERTPITPPMAYMDFLKAMSVPSPIVPEKRSDSGTVTPEDDSSAHDSVPSTASSEQTDCSCKCGSHKSPAAVTSSPYPTHPMSAPPTGATSFPCLNIPPSPAISHLDTPLSATARSPFSARSVRSPFDWEAALKSRYAQDSRAQKSTGKSVRHIREVVTRTVTYTPRMNPAPKGKRRRTHSNCPKAEAPPAATRSNSA